MAQNWRKEFLERYCGKPWVYKRMMVLVMPCNLLSWRAHGVNNSIGMLYAVGWFWFACFVGCYGYC
jgi:hypothetical protein